MKQTTTGTAERFGLLLLTFFASLAACGQALLLLHLRLNRLPLLLAGVVMLLVARKLSRTPLFDLAALTAGLLALGMVCGQIYDLSWDGQTYHQEAVYQLAHGWNPVWNAPLPMWHRDIEWINCYPKGNWIIGAILYLSGKQIESAKLLSPALMVTAVLLGYAACRALSLKRGMSGLLALLAALCPVAVCQLGSFYVDGSLGSLLTLLLSLAVLYVKQPRGRYLLAMIAAMTWLGVQYVLFAWDQETPILNWNFGLVYLAVPLGSALMLVHLLCIARPYILARKFDQSETFNPEDAVL